MSDDDIPLSPAFGYRNHKRSGANLSLFDDGNSQYSSSLTPEQEAEIEASSREAANRFSQYSPDPRVEIIKSSFSDEDARALFIAERDGSKGRPSYLTPERVQIIIQEIERGTPAKIAAELSGVKPGTFNSWMSRAADDIRNDKDSSEVRFAIEIFKAERRLQSRLANKWVKIVTEPTTKRKTVWREKVDANGNVIRYMESDIVESNGDGNWQGIAEYMSRRFEGWKKSERIEQTGPNGGPIQVATVDINSLTTEQRELLYQIAKGQMEKNVTGSGEGKEEE